MCPPTHSWDRAKVVRGLWGSTWWMTATRDRAAVVDRALHSDS